METSMFVISVPREYLVLRLIFHTDSYDVATSNNISLQIHHFSIKNKVTH